MSLPPPVPGSQAGPSQFPPPYRAPGRGVPPPYRPPIKARPGWGWYLGIAGFAVAMGIVAIVVMVASVVGYVADLDRIDAGAEGRVIHLDEGGYTVYVEGGRWSTTSLSSALRVVDPEGRVVELRDYYGTHTYERGAREGVAALTFRAERDGDYRVTLSRGEPSADGATVYIGPGFARHVGASIRRGILVGLLGIVVAVAATIALAVARGRSRRRQLAEHSF